MTMQSVQLHIGELVLHEFQFGDRYHIAEAIARELHRLIAEQGLPSTFNSSRETSFINAGSVQVSEDSRPDKVGTLIARILYKGMNG